MDYSEFDRIYELYGYEPIEHNGIRVYEFRHGRYFGVDILINEGQKESSIVRKVCQEYQKENFSVAVRTCESFDEIEEDLFRSFFQVDTLNR